MTIFVPALISACCCGSSFDNWVCSFELNSKPKKSSSSKTPAKNQETPLVGDEKPSLKPKKSSNEIDEIFAGKKRKPEGKKTHKSNKDETVEPKLMKEKKTEKKKSKIATEGDFADPPAWPKKRSEDGLVLYT